MACHPLSTPQNLLTVLRQSSTTELLSRPAGSTTPRTETPEEAGGPHPPHHHILMPPQVGMVEAWPDVVLAGPSDTISSSVRALTHLLALPTHGNPAPADDVDPPDYDNDAFFDARALG